MRSKVIATLITTIIVASVAGSILDTTGTIGRYVVGTVAILLVSAITICGIYMIWQFIYDIQQP